MSHHRYNVGAMQLLQMCDGQGCNGWTNWPSKQYAPWAQDWQTRAAAGVLSKLEVRLENDLGTKAYSASPAPQWRDLRLAAEMYDFQSLMPCAFPLDQCWLLERCPSPEGFHRGAWAVKYFKKDPTDRS